MPASSLPPPSASAVRPPVPSRPSPSPSASRPAPPRPAAAVDPLTGGAPDANPVVVAKIDNTYTRVEQFGLSSADVVFVEQVEGGLTRLIAVFHSDLDVEVGPVRSVRTTDVQMLPVFGPAPILVFSGGNDGVLASLHTTSIIDSSGFGGYFRSAAVMQSGRTHFSFRDGHFVRTRSGNVVSDFQGRPQVADNVVIQHVTDQPDGYVDSTGSPSYLSITVGTGKITLLRDGHAIEGTWRRSAAGLPFSYTDDAGRALPFKPGKTWVILAPQSASITLS